MIKVIGPPATAASTVAENWGISKVFMVIKETKNPIVKYGIYAIKKRIYLFKVGALLKII